ncbi:ABC transporter substrate-binding protein [uncultured Streptomyces sp.]|uniref:ABC transporter substrate-binding protein n=1 Tax=uncultured Streptomyces sp. TaxID=174707 RepID=UPI00260173D8|nr:ABC transporter substrate-binding protein [uncultured Streptomyces sp.]
MSGRATRTPPRGARRRPGALLLAAVAVVVSVTACSQESAPGGGATVAVEGALGTAKITGTPRRVVALDTTSADLAVALGTKPVAMAEAEGTAGSVLPWTAKSLTGKRPVLFSAAAGDPVARIAAYKPDVILAVGDRRLPDSYTALTAVAPVVHYTIGPDTDSWQAMTRTVARALRVPDRGEQLIAAADQAAADARAAHPALVGERFSLLLNPMPHGVGAANSRKDPSGRVLGKLGLKLDEVLNQLPPSSYPGRTYLAYEDLAVADTDLVFATGADDAMRTLEEQPAFRSLKAVKEGRYVRLDPTLAQALADPTPRSIEYAVEQLAGRVDAVVRK